MKSKFSLKYQFSLYIVILISIIITSIVLFVRAQEKEALTSEMKLRGNALIKTLAGNVGEIFLTVGSSDLISLSAFVDQIKEEKGVFNIWIAKKNGSLIIHSNPDIQRQVDEHLIKRKKYYFKNTIPLKAIENNSPEILTLFNSEFNSYQISKILMIKNRKIGIVGLNLSKKMVDATINSAIRKLLYISIGSILFGIICTFILVSILVKPINKLAVGAGIIGKGNLDYRIEIDSRNEIGELAQSFNKMTQDLKLAQKQMVEKERIEKEIQIARNIQQSLLPKGIPKINKYSFGALYRSAKEVGGDYYDFIKVDPENLGIVVADVSGKGVPAAVIMAITRSILRSFAPGNLSPYDVLKIVHYLLLQNIYKEMFVTAFYGILNIKNNSLKFVKAGHNYLIIYRAEKKECEIIKSKGTALGITKAERFNKILEEVNIKLQKNDIIVQYSDGVNESMNDKGEMYTNERLYENIKKYGELDAQGLVNKIDETVTLWAKNTPQSDDISIVAVKVEE